MKVKAGTISPLSKKIANQVIPLLQLDNITTSWSAKPANVLLCSPCCCSAFLPQNRAFLLFPHGLDWAKTGLSCPSNVQPSPTKVVVEGVCFLKQKATRVPDCSIVICEAVSVVDHPCKRLTVPVEKNADDTVLQLEISSFFTAAHTYVDEP